VGSLQEEPLIMAVLMDTLEFPGTLGVFEHQDAVDQSSDGKIRLSHSELSKLTLLPTFSPEETSRSFQLMFA
jgi:hypothetical protein